MDHTTQKSAIMRRIYLIHTIRMIKYSVFTKIVLFAAGFIALASSVSIKHIVANAPKNSGELLSFFMSAFAHTHTTVQILLVVLASVGIWIIGDLVNRLHPTRKNAF